MKALPTIGLVMPSYNHARFLEEAIASVLSQDYPRLKFAVMDGGSTDGSVQIIQRYSPRLTYWQSQPDGGQGRAILAGWRVLGDECDLVGWINSDDLLLPGALDAVATAYREGRHLYYGDRLVISETGEAVHYAMLPKVPAWAFKNALIMPAQPGTFYDRRLAADVGFFDPSLVTAMEYDLIVRMFAAGAKPQLVSERPLGALRCYGDTKTVQLRSLMRNEIEQVYSRISGPLGAWRAHIIASKIAWWVAAARYLNPLNLRRIARKLSVSRNAAGPRA